MRHTTGKKAEFMFPLAAALMVEFAEFKLDKERGERVIDAELFGRISDFAKKWFDATGYELPRNTVDGGNGGEVSKVLDRLRNTFLPGIPNARALRTKASSVHGDIQQSRTQNVDWIDLKVMRTDIDIIAKYVVNSRRNLVAIMNALGLEPIGVDSIIEENTFPAAQVLAGK